MKSLTLLLPIALLAVAANASKTCKIVGSANANCRKCAQDDSSCAVAEVLTLGSSYSFSCRETGGTVSGDNGWDYYPSGKCYVWEVLTDDNCSPSALPACSGGSTGGSGSIPGPMKNDYPWSGQCLDSAGNDLVDDYNYYRCQCTSFVAWRINSRLGISFTNRYKGQLWGNANLWGGAAQASGITVNTNPVAGSIAWDNSNQHGAGSAGHVAWVAAVGSDTITIEEYNWNGGDMKYNTRTVAHSGFTGYIHIKV